MSFVHLHVHSEYSWLDGACCIDDLVQRAVQYKMPAVAITDRNSVAGASRLWHRCVKAGIKPIIGLEIEVLNDPGDGRAFSVILLAKNGSGYENLCRLVTLAYEADPDTPRVSKSQLREHARHLICLSFSVAGELCTLLLEGNDEQARQVSDWYHEVFGEDYYYEIQNHGLPSEAVAMNKLLNLAWQTRIPVVLTNDCHYLDRKDSIAIDALNCIRKGIDLGHPEAKRFACNEYYFKSPKEMKSLSGFAPQLVRNSLAIADKIDVTDGYIPVYGSGLPASKVFGLLNRYPSALKVNLKPRIGHLTISLNGHKSDGVLEYLRQQLPDIEFIRFTEYYPWTVRSIFGAVLNAMKVPEEKIREFRELIPAGAMTLREAALISTDFSCLSSEDYVCALAAEMADTLINTFREKMLLKHNYALVQKGTPIPIARETEGNLRCIYNQEVINEMGFITIEFKG
jgi:hypothetical protein